MTPEDFRQIFGQQEEARGSTGATYTDTRRETFISPGGETVGEHEHDGACGDGGREREFVCGGVRVGVETERTWEQSRG